MPKKKIDRTKELEKIAKKLGIGQNREVKCVSCKEKIEFKDAVVLTNKKKVAYLCKECNIKLEKGELDKKPIDDIVDELEKLKKQDIDKIPGRHPVPYIPSNPYEDIEWKEFEKNFPWNPGKGRKDVTYMVSNAEFGSAQMKSKKGWDLMKFEPIKNGNKTNASTR